MKGVLSFTIFIVLLSTFLNVALAQERDLKAYYFWSSNCEPCHTASPEYHKATTDYDIPIIDINVNENPTLAKKYCIESVPSIVLTSNGKYINSYIGLAEATDVKGFLSRSLSMPVSSIGCNEQNVAIKQKDTNDVQDEILKPKGIDENPSTKNFPVTAVISGLVLAGAITIAASRLLKNRLVPSPVDGEMVSQSQATHEQRLLDQGYSYNPQKDGFDYVPKKVNSQKSGTSYLSKEIAKEKSTRHARYKAQEVKRKQAIRKEDIKDEFKLEARKYKRSMDRIHEMDKFSTGAEVVEGAADVGVDALSYATGPAGKVIKEVYQGVKDINTVTNDVIDHGKTKGGLIGSTKVLFGRIRSKLIGKGLGKTGLRGISNIGASTANKALDEAIKRPGEKVIKETASKISSKE